MVCANVFGLWWSRGLLTMMDSARSLPLWRYGLEWSDVPAGDGASTLPGLAAALERGIGLGLEKSSQDFDVLVIDHVERVPAGN